MTMVTYKIRVNRPCRLFIDDEEIAILEELKIFSIELPEGDYLRKVVAVDDFSIVDEQVISLSKIAKLDIITLSVCGLDDVKFNVFRDLEVFKVDDLYYKYDKRFGSIFVSSEDIELGNSYTLENVNIPEYIYYKGFRFLVSGIAGHAFSRCKSLRSIKIPNTITYIGNYAFSNSSIRSIDIHKDVSFIGNGVFSQCEYLTSINVDERNSQYLSIDGVLFSRGYGQEPDYSLVAYPASREGSYHVPHDVKKILESAFSGSKYLTNVNFSDSVSEIGSGAFFGCISLNSLKVGIGVEKIEQWAFASCSYLTSITIPKSIRSMDSQVFMNCNELTDIYYHGSIKQWNSIDFGFFSLDFKNSVTIHCIDGEIEM